MKSLLTLLLATGIVSVALADIHSPPGSDFGPTRKLGRAFANIAYGVGEVPHCIAVTNNSLGNNAAMSYGIARGVGRTLSRLRYGVQELVLFPFPVYKGKYTPPYPSETIWIYKGMQEFPPELGWSTRPTWQCLRE